MIVSQILPHLLFGILGKTSVPARNGLIVVGAGIDNTVGVIVVGPVVIGGADVGRINGKL